MVPSLVAGVGLALSLPPWGFWVLAFPSAGLVWWRLRGLRVRARVLAGWAMGLGMFVPGLWWVTTFNTYGGLVLMAVESLVPALACAVTPRGVRGRTAALAGAMVLGETVRGSWPFGGLPMGGIALGQASGPLAGADRLGGPLLLVGLVWLGGAGLGLVTTAVVRGVADTRTGKAVPTGRQARAGLLSGAVVAAVVAGAAWWGAVAPDGGAGVHTLRVASVQGGGVRGLRKAEVDPATVTAAQFEATAAIASNDGGRAPSLVLWPEDVVSLDNRIDGTPIERELGALAKRLHGTLLVGVTETVSTQSFRNEIVAFSPDGKLVDRFEKVHRVPFGEYIPYRGFFKHLADLSSVPLDAIPGHGTGVLHTPAGPLGTLVSYEVFYSQRGRITTRAGAQLLVDPTNTSSYLTSQVPTQEIAAARLQAIAEGRDVVQAAPTGYSAVIDHRGRVLVRSKLGVRAVIVRDVELRKGRTIYERFGDLPVLVLSGLLVAAGWLSALTSDTDPELTAGARRERQAFLQRRALRSRP
ncbi:MAG TPA: apolipoprotein N-acyltransferase [Acidimicrobiales bacterium]